MVAGDDDSQRAFRSFTDLRPADTETLIFELYSVYKTQFTGEMSFDDFWSWGEVIINDFNDIDLYLADAEKLYSNIIRPEGDRLQNSAD